MQSQFFTSDHSRPLSAIANNPSGNPSPAVSHIAKTWRWIPAFAGMIGFIVVCCHPVEAQEQKTIPAEILLESDIADRSLVSGMKLQIVERNLEALGWQKDERLNHIKASTFLWTYHPCKAAAIDLIQTYTTNSNDRPPKPLRLNATFYECLDGEPLKMDGLANIEIREDKNAKNT